MPQPFLPQGAMKRRVYGLRDSETPPATYKKYQLQPDGTVLFVGEFPTPQLHPKFNVKLSRNI